MRHDLDDRVKEKLLADLVGVPAVSLAPKNVGARKAYSETYREFLSRLTAADLDRVIERQGRRAITYAWAVGHIAEHESYHIGKCTLLRSLLAAR